MRAAGTELLNIVKCFGSGSGQVLLFSYRMIANEYCSLTKRRGYGKMERGKDGDGDADSETA